RHPRSQPHPQLDPHGGSVRMGPSEPGSALTQQRGCLAREQGQSHLRDSPASSSPWRLGAGSPTGVTAPGADVTIWCQGQRQDVRFFLHKTGDLNPQQHMDPAGAGAEFRIPTVGRQHGGNYSCSYRPRSEPFVSSQPSDPVQLVIGSYPKPSISVSPSGLIPVGGKVTIQCWHQRLGMRFLFYKAGDGNYLTYTDPAGSKAEFPIISARRDHGGSYTCRYHDKSGIYSEPSDPVQIIVAGEGPSPPQQGGRSGGSHDRPVSGSAPGSGVCSVQGWGQERSSVGRGLGWGRISHPQSEPGRGRQLHLLLLPQLRS
uniref:Immunoglobulin domain-containing protein n=1 Tax=Gopherus evgoodei TaxID=1825980 RepID=A0A8C4W330_9SAUR